MISEDLIMTAGTTNNYEETECLQGIFKPTNIGHYYNQESQYPFPSLIICDDKLTKQNKNIFELATDDRPVILADVNGEQLCGGSLVQPFNVRNLSNSGADHQKFFSKNIDVDSELKRINFYDDKCFYDRFKIHPNKVTPQQSPLACHKDMIVKNYEKDKMYKQTDCLQPTQRTSFQPCESEASNYPVHYRFNNNQYCKSWPCQRMFNNQTKRSTLTNLHNPHNINPDCLDCINTI